MSHFNDIGATEDGFPNPIYGFTPSRILAMTSPDKAMRHADSFAYYVEGAHSGFLRVLLQHHKLLSGARMMPSGLDKQYEKPTIIGILTEDPGEKKMAELRHTATPRTTSGMRKFDDMTLSNAPHLRLIETENTQIKHFLADFRQHNAELKDITSQK